MKALNTYFINDDSCLRIKFNSRSVDNTKVMRYARCKANCPYFRVMKAKKPYTVFKLELMSLDSNDESELYKLVKIGVIE